MAKNNALYCYACRRGGREEAKENPDISVTRTHIDGMGTRWYSLVCGWCGHRWETECDARRLPGYREAEAAREG